jgi:hypothetical protein
MDDIARNQLPGKECLYSAISHTAIEEEAFSVCHIRERSKSIFMMGEVWGEGVEILKFAISFRA